MSAASSSLSAENKRKSAPLSKDGDLASETSNSVAAASVARRLAAAYRGIDGYAIARERRKKMRAAGQYEGTESLTYGEIDTAAFYNFLCELPLNKSAASHEKPDKNATGLRFLDIGSGTGKPVFAAALLPAFTHCAGIEIVQDLHDSALKAQASLADPSNVVEDQDGDADAAHSACDDNSLPAVPAPVEFHCNDSFSESDAIVTLWRQANVIFAPTTCFTDEMMEALCQRINQDVKPGTVIVTNTRGLPSKVNAKMLFRRRLKYGRGALDFIVHRFVAGSPTKRASDKSDDDESSEQDKVDAQSDRSSKKQRAA
jgi:SAM-dependent methyltransferase